MKKIINQTKREGFVRFDGINITGICEQIIEKL